jgi:hypothetical protein
MFLQVKRFGYWRDPLCLMGCVLYATNRWLIKPHVHSAFMKNHFNDVLLIPCALPWLLLLERWMRLRKNDEVPTVGEIAMSLVIWSILFEVIGPHLMRRATGDPWDVVAYVAGGIVAGLWWHRASWMRRRQT